LAALRAGGSSMDGKRDIQDRAFRFACDVVGLHDRLYARGGSTRTLCAQLLRSGTSIGANLEEATGGQSRADFTSKCTIALKEARESLYWLRVMRACGKIDESSDALLRDADRLVAIITAIVKKTRQSVR
jgi:four helix bundle protein